MQQTHLVEEGGQGKHVQADGHESGYLQQRTPSFHGLGHYRFHGRHLPGGMLGWSQPWRMKRDDGRLRDRPGLEESTHVMSKASFQSTMPSFTPLLSVFFIANKELNYPRSISAGFANGKVKLALDTRLESAERPS